MLAGSATQLHPFTHPPISPCLLLLLPLLQTSWPSPWLARPTERPARQPAAAAPPPAAAAAAWRLGVPLELIQAMGAVSAPVAREMAEGALARSRADIAVAVTGVAGPGGGSVEKPVGLVWFGLAQRGRPVHSASPGLPGDRAAIREATVAKAFALIRSRL